MEPGDWKCVCGEMNFKKRDICRKCRKSKPKSGDWNCSCGEMNFASRTACRKCGNVRLQNPPLKPSFRPKPGDWICKQEKCGEHNFGFRDICRKCLKPVRENPRSDSNNNSTNQSSDLESEEITCVICLTESRTHAITKCGHLCYCGICGFNINKCPICRVEYDPDNDLIKIYNV
jgi:hypothetical protein